MKRETKLFDYNYDIICKTFYLADNLVDDDYAKWFESKCINVLNKTCCGNGGTTGFINYARKHFKGLLVLAPNVSICKSKEIEYKGCDDVCCVYGGSDFRKDATVVIATYDQFHKMMKELDDYGVKYNDDWSSTLWSGRTILIDEYHKITDECSFRDICYDVTKLIKRHDNGVILMSATPHWKYVEFLKEYMPERDVKVYTVKYEKMDDLLIDQGVTRLIQLYDVKKKFADIISKTYRSKKNKQIVIFYNNRDDVKKLMQKMEVKDVEVLCSGEHKEDFGEYYSPIFNENKKLHFMTSAYFTGCDINVHVNVCIIIGSRIRSFLSYGGRDIKQMIGRFRKGCSGVHLFYNGKVKDIYDYNENKTEFDKCQNYLNSIEGDWRDDDEAVKYKQKSLMLQDRLDNAEHWKDIKAVKKMLEEYGYEVKEKKIGEFEAIVKPKKLSLKETKERIIKGIPVNWMENSIVVQCKAYCKEKGADAFWRASQSDIKNWYKVYKNDKDNVGGDNEKISTMLPHELFDAIIKNEGYYSGRFLKACLEYVGVKCNYDELSERFYETFDAYACCLSNDSIGSRSKWLVCKKVLKNTPFCHDLTESHYNNEYTSKHDILGCNTLISYNNKMEDNHCLAKTFYLKKRPFNSLTGIALYDWVMEDKPKRLPSVKGDKKWSIIKNYKQSKISEMFRFTTNQYRHSIKEMEYINCLICDIDSGIAFSKFKEMYKNYMWFAYPTLNNNSKDWLKFRVIVQLDEPIELKGENNLKVLKVLRTMFCYYEDPNHQMASYINQEDWENRYENNGELYHIEQSLVDDLMLRIKNFKEFKYSAKEITASEITTSYMTLEGAKEHFERSFKFGDGKRYRALFVIKNRLSETDRALFEDWLVSNHPTYLTKWKCHKIVTLD